MSDFKVLAIIPARGGSKRLPGKNKKIFLGKPLISWSIEAAMASNYVTDIILTTDDEDILNLKSSYPTIKFIKRPEHLALDSTSSVDVVLDLMQKIKIIYDYILLLQPTSPLRTHFHIDAALEKIRASNKKQLVSVKSADFVFKNMVCITNGKANLLRELVINIPVDDSLKVLNGAIYISDWKTLLFEKTFLGSSVDLYEMDEAVSVDIDTSTDWKLAEFFSSLQKINES